MCSTATTPAVQEVAQAHACPVCSCQYDVVGNCPCVYQRDRCLLPYLAQHPGPHRFHQFEEPH